MSSAEDSAPDLPWAEPPVDSELERRVRSRGVRVEPRLALLRLLREEDGQGELARRIEALEQRMRAASRDVITALRRSGR